MHDGGLMSSSISGIDVLVATRLHVASAPELLSHVNSGLPKSSRMHDDIL